MRQLDTLKVGESGLICAIAAPQDRPLVRQRLIEMGFDVGVPVSLLHVGPFGGDPICVEVGHTKIALRRAEAALVTLEPCA